MPIAMHCVLLQALLLLLPSVAGGANSGCSAAEVNTEQCSSTPGSGAEVSGDDGSLIHLLAARRSRFGATLGNHSGADSDPGTPGGNSSDMQRALDRIRGLSQEEALEALAEEVPGMEAEIREVRGAWGRVSAAAGRAYGCRRGKGRTVGLWTDIEGVTPCHTKTTFYCPTSVQQLRMVVMRHRQVRAFGYRASWAPFTCTTGPKIEAATINMQGLNKILGISEDELSVRTQPGVRTRDLMRYLANEGYVLTAPPFYIDQSIGGAVSTGTHGSDVRKLRQTLSSTIKSMVLMTANGATVHLDRHMDLEVMRAATLSVGKLGVIVELELDIERDFCMRGTVTHWSENEYLSMLEILEAQAISHDSVQVAQTQQVAMHFLWYPFSRTFSGERFAQAPQACEAQPRQTLERLLPNVVYRATPRQSAAPADFDEYRMYVQDRTFFCDGDCMSSTGQATNTPLFSDLTLREFPHDQYEFAVPFSKMHTCFSVLIRDVLTTDRRRAVIGTTTPRVSFVGKADELLSATASENHLFVSFDVDVAHRRHTTEECTDWDAVEGHLRGPICGGRLHFGRSGWERTSSAEATEMYPGIEAFRKVMHAWDPLGKFGGIFTPAFEPAAPALAPGACAGSAAACEVEGRQVSRCACTAALPDGGNCEWTV